MFEVIPEENAVNHKTHFDLQKMLREEQAVASYCIASWESFLSNSWYFYEIAAPIRSGTSKFYISRLFHNTFLASTYMCVCMYAYITLHITLHIITLHIISFYSKSIKKLILNQTVSSSRGKKTKKRRKKNVILKMNS